MKIMSQHKGHKIGHLTVLLRPRDHQQYTGDSLVLQLSSQSLSLLLPHVFVLKKVWSSMVCLGRVRCSPCGFFLLSVVWSLYPRVASAIKEHDETEPDGGSLPDVPEKKVNLFKQIVISQPGLHDINLHMAQLNWRRTTETFGTSVSGPTFKKTVLLRWCMWHSNKTWCFVSFQKKQRMNQSNESN